MVGLTAMSGAGSVLQFATGVLIARILGPEARGIVALVAATYSQVSQAATLGSGLGVIHYLGLKQMSTRSALVTAFKFSVILGPIAVAAILLAYWLLIRDVSVPGIKLAVIILAATAPLTMFSGFTNGILLTVGRVIEASVLNFIERSIYVLFVFIVLLSGADTVGVIASSIAAIVLGFALKTGYALTRSPEPVRTTRVIKLVAVAR